MMPGEVIQYTKGEDESLVEVLRNILRRLDVLEAKPSPVMPPWPTIEPELLGKAPNHPFEPFSYTERS